MIRTITKWLTVFTVVGILIGTFFLGRWSNIIRQSFDTYHGTTTVMFGDPSNTVNLSLIGPDTYTDSEARHYLHNLSVIIKSLPNNIPTRAVLMEFTIRNVRYFDDYAKIEFSDDARIWKHDRSPEIYRGQF